MNAFIDQYLVYFKVMAAVLLVALLFGAGWMANGWRLNAQIAEIKADRANDKAVQATGALKELTDATAKINAAASGALVNIATLNETLDNLQTEWKNAKPLPTDCRPDDFRMRQLAAAVDAVKQALAGSKPGATVQDPVSP